MELGASRQARHREQPASRGDRIEARDGRGRKQAGGPPEASDTDATKATNASQATESTRATGAEQQPAGDEPSVRRGTAKAGRAAEPDARETVERRTELVDATRYDLDRLERAVRRLVVRQQELVAENEALRKDLRDREAAVERLDAELRSSQERRQHALQRVDGLIGELDRLDALLDASVAGWAASGDEAAQDEDSASTPLG